MIGIAANTKAERRGLVTTIMAPAPTNSTRLRSATDTEAPTAALICVVSAVRREITSPVLAPSKKAGDGDVRGANTLLRKSATMRSPSGDEVVAKRARERQHRRKPDHHQEIAVDQ